MTPERQPLPPTQFDPAPVRDLAADTQQDALEQSTRMAGHMNAQINGGNMEENMRKKPETSSISGGDIPTDDNVAETGFDIKRPNTDKKAEMLRINLGKIASNEANKK